MKKHIAINIIVLLLSFSALFARFNVTGRVINDEYKPVAKAKIEFKGTTKKIKTETNAKGYFSFETSDSSGTLTIISKSYSKKQIKVFPYNNESYLITLSKEYKISYRDKGIYRATRAADYGGADDALTARAEGGELAIYKASLDFSEHTPSFSQDNVSAKILTAGDINDFKKWRMWNDISENELFEYRKNWSFSPVDRYTVQLKSTSSSPIVDALVTLKDGQKVLWQSRTDNTGKAELWTNAFNIFENYSNLIVEVKYKNRSYFIEKPKTFYDGINFLEIDENCNYDKNLDIAFVVDATGSMGDEIEYLKAELTDIIGRVKDTIPDMSIRISASFYRDFGDEYLVKSVDFTKDIAKLVDFIKTNYADGGGDFPEAVDYALEEAIDNLTWSENATARIIFLVLDAPPHSRPDVIERLQKYIRLASAKGIRIVPLTCSGIDKSTEYLMRAFALLTNGTYLFLTDDSGIGGKHLEPTTDNYSVQLLNSLILRTIYQFSYLPPCITKTVLTGDTLIVANPNNEAINSVMPSDEMNNYSDDFEIKWKYYPNPCTGILNIELKQDLKELFIADITGKIIYRIENSSNRLITIDLTSFPNGYYFIRYEYAPDKWLNGKFILQSSN